MKRRIRNNLIVPIAYSDPKNIKVVDDSCHIALTVVPILQPLTVEGMGFNSCIDIVRCKVESE